MLSPNENRQTKLSMKKVIRKRKRTENPASATVEFSATNIKNKREYGSLPKNGLSSLQQQMKSKLEAANFRMLNEAMYTSTGAEAKAMLDKNPSLFSEYHTGFARQVQRWPHNPLDDVISFLSTQRRDLQIADLGCGEARLAHDVPQENVHSFDLVATNERVKACDIARLPLEDCSVDVVVFCLSLMGSNYGDYITEARRVLIPNGLVLVAEVASRFENHDPKQFIQGVESLGFCLEKDSPFVKNGGFHSHESRKKRRKRRKKTAVDEESKQKTSPFFYKFAFRSLKTNKADKSPSGGQSCYNWSFTLDIDFRDKREKQFSKRGSWEQMETSTHIERIFTKKTDEELEQLSVRLTNREQELRKRLSDLNHSLLVEGRLMRLSNNEPRKEATHRERAMATLRRKRVVERQLQAAVTMREQLDNTVSLREEARVTIEAHDAAMQAANIPNIGDADVINELESDLTQDIDVIIGGTIWNANTQNINDAEFEAELEEDVQGQSTNTQLPFSEKYGSSHKAIPQTSSRNEEDDLSELNVEDDDLRPDISIDTEDNAWLKKLADDDDEEVAQAAKIFRQHSLNAPQPGGT